jgi:hypothetical protein
LTAQGHYDIPEECPVCGYPNADDDGQPIYPDDPAFCSKHCTDQYAADQRFHDTMLYLEIQEQQRFAE